MRDFTGKNNPRWNGGIKIHAYGYRLIASPNHPFKDKQGYVREHRLVMEKHLGRYLRIDELVHHINHNKIDNRIENLELTTRSEHKIKDHPEIGMATRFKKGLIPFNKNPQKSNCKICDKVFYVSLSLLKSKRTCGDAICKTAWRSFIMKKVRENGGYTQIYDN